MTRARRHLRQAVVLDAAILSLPQDRTYSSSGQVADVCCYQPTLTRTTSTCAARCTRRRTCAHSPLSVPSDQVAQARCRKHTHSLSNLPHIGASTDGMGAYSHKQRRLTALFLLHAVRREMFLRIPCDTCQWVRRDMFQGGLRFGAFADNAAPHPSVNSTPSHPLRFPEFGSGKQSGGNYSRPHVGGRRGAEQRVQRGWSVAPPRKMHVRAPPRTITKGVRTNLLPLLQFP